MLPIISPKPCLYSIEPTLNILFVELLNVGKTNIDSIGSVKLSNDMTLKYVLYVPDFKVNLLSISKLTHALGCNVTFYPDACVVQDLTTKKTIGSSSQSNGLYYLTVNQNPDLATPSTTHPTFGIDLSGTLQTLLSNYYLKVRHKFYLILMIFVMYDP